MRCRVAYREAFALFDKDHNGKITASELSTVMGQLGLKPTDAEVRKMIKEVDKNTNDTVEFDEFCVMMKKQVKLRDAERELRDAFKVRFVVANV
jgi:Ca2+-binding EF-hand superfamily protein